jgi:transketolase
MNNNNNLTKKTGEPSIRQLKLNHALRLNLSSVRISTRDGYGEALFELGKNKNIVVLCADLSESIKLHKFKEAYPSRFVQVGVAEQNLVTVASGLAAVGKIPFASSYAVFCPGRCLEQIRTTICYNDQNVKISGAHAGISVGPDGATHQALEDIAMMRSLPNMIVIVPADKEQTRKATLAIAKHLGPCYLRFARDKAFQITTKNTPFRIGQAQVIKEGTDLAIVAAGPVLEQCLLAASLLQKKNISVQVINCHTVKPLDKKTILRSAKRCKKIITVEEAQVAGGLGSAITEYLSEVYPVPIVRLGIQDKFGESGTPEELFKKFGLTAENIYAQALKLVRSK